MGLTTDLRGFTRIFLTSDFTDFTDGGYAFVFGRDGEGARENTSRGESRTITNSVVLLK